MSDNLISPTGKQLTRVTVHNTTPKSSRLAKPVKVKADPSVRRAENKVYLQNENVRAFIDTIALAEGGDYNMKYGGVKNKKNDKWQGGFKLEVRHPRCG